MKKKRMRKWQILAKILHECGNRYNLRINMNEEKKNKMEDGTTILMAIHLNLNVQDVCDSLFYDL